MSVTDLPKSGAIAQFVADPGYGVGYKCEAFLVSQYPTGNPRNAVVGLYYRKVPHPGQCFYSRSCPRSAFLMITDVRPLAWCSVNADGKERSLL